MDLRTRKKAIFVFSQPSEEENASTQEPSITDEIVPEQRRIRKESIVYEALEDDTLARIAAINKTTISDLMRENKFISSLIHPGQLIRVPRQNSFGSENTIEQKESVNISQEDIKESGKTETKKMTRQRSISEHKGPSLESLTISDGFRESFRRKNKTRKNSLAVLVESVRSKFSRPPSSENIIQAPRQRAKSLASGPLLKQLELGFERKERKLSEVKRKKPDPEPVSFLSEILFPTEVNSVGTVLLSGERLTFESHAQTNTANYVYYSIKYEDIVNVTLWKAKNLEEPLNFTNMDQFDLLEIENELRNIIFEPEEEEEEDDDESTIAESKPGNYFMSVRVTKDNPYFIHQHKDYSDLWFTLPSEKLSYTDKHLRLALAICYTNLSEEEKLDLSYDLKVNLQRGELIDVNENGQLNASVKFKKEKTTLYKSRTIHGGLNPYWRDSFTIENVILDDVIRVKVYHGATAIGLSNLLMSDIPLKVNHKIVLEMQGIDDARHTKVGSIYLECQLLPQGSPAKLPCVPFPTFHPSSQIISMFHVAKLIDNLPLLMTSSQAWRLVYSNMVHGSSLNTLYSKMGECSNDDCIVLVIKDSELKVFGAYLTSPIKPSKTSYGTGECFLFTFQSSFQKYEWSGGNMSFIRSDENGISIGSGKSGDGLWINENIWDGYTDVSETFDNLPLTTDKSFHIQSIETWQIEV